MDDKPDNITLAVHDIANGTLSLDVYYDMEKEINELRRVMSNIESQALCVSVDRDCDETDDWMNIAQMAENALVDHETKEEIFAKHEREIRAIIEKHFGWQKLGELEPGVWPWDGSYVCAYYPKDEWTGEDWELLNWANGKWYDKNGVMSEAPTHARRLTRPEGE